jgi:hypothetical protein
MSCDDCECENVPPYRDPDEFPYLDWYVPQKLKSDTGKYQYVKFCDIHGSPGRAILYLGKTPHIHGLYTDYSDLSGDSVYSFKANIYNILSGGEHICPYWPRKVISGSVALEDDKYDPNRIAIQQHVIAFNQKQHRAADMIREAIPEAIIPELKRIIVEYAVLIPIGPRLKDQIIPTFHIDTKYAERCILDSVQNANSKKRTVAEDLHYLQKLFHVFDWHATNPRICRWERPRASVEVLE